MRGQIKFIEELDRLEKRRHEEQEREILLRAAKVSSIIFIVINNYFCFNFILTNLVNLHYEMAKKPTVLFKNLLCLLLEDYENICLICNYVFRAGQNWKTQSS